MFPRECWLISHQFVNAINVALHGEWDHFQDLRHTNCLVWSLLQSSLLCLNQLNCSTEELGPASRAWACCLLIICGCDWCGYWEVKGKKTLWLLVWNCGHLVAKMWDELVFKYCWEITWWRVWGLRWHGEKRSIETGHKALLTTSMPANSQGSIQHSRYY